MPKQHSTAETENGLAVYVHWPFCLSKCPYCDFNSHVAKGVDQTEWLGAYAKEIGFYASLLPGRKAKSVFFGGGTPSLMKPETVAGCLDVINTHWPLERNCEITLEANPTSVESQKFIGFRHAGVTRISVGLQSLDDAALSFLGRTHSAAEGVKALEVAQNIFTHVSADLIYARADQTLQQWEQELGKALSLGTEHLSLYQLTIEPQTPFHTQYQRGAFIMPDEDVSAAFYALTADMTADAGFMRYEVSNYARDNAFCRHNMAYWEYRDYVGIGPGAHGRLSLNGQKTAIRAHRAPEIWLSRVRDNGHGAHPFENLSSRTALEECVLMNLRLSQGFDLRRIEHFSSRPWQMDISPSAIQTLVAEGYVRLNGATMYVTAEGFLRLNALIDFLLDSRGKSDVGQKQEKREDHVA